MFVIRQSVVSDVIKPPCIAARVGNLILSNSSDRYPVTIPTKVAADLGLKIVDLGDATLEGDLLLFYTDTEIDTISSITIDRLTYSLSNQNPPPLGSFVYDQRTGLVRVSLSKPVQANSRAILKVFGTPPSGTLAPVKKDTLCGLTPVSLGILNKWNSDGKITISRRFQDHASLTFSFAVCETEEGGVIRDLYNGRVFTAFNIQWVVTSLTIRHKAITSRIAVSVSCQDFLASRGNPSLSPIDTRVYKGGGSVFGGTVINGLYVSEAGGSISSAASRSRVSYTGAEIRYRVPKSTSSEESTSVRELLTSRAIKTHGFPFYTNGHGVENRNWYKTRTHFISGSQVRSESIDYTYQGQGSRLGGVQLHTEYRNLEINLDFDEDNTSDGSQGLTNRWSFENCTDLGSCMSPNEFKGFYYEAPDDSVIKNPGSAFDAGGPTKSATRIWELNGTIVREEFQQWGYVLTSLDEYIAEHHAKPVPAVIADNDPNEYDDPAGDGSYFTYKIRFKDSGSPTTYWKQVKSTVSNYIYDKNGYLIRIVTTGTKTARLSQESDALEAINLILDGIKDQDSRETLSDNGTRVEAALDPNYAKKAEAYKFVHNLPVVDTTSYVLDKHENYFEDTVKPGDACDQNWVTPKFVRSMTRFMREQIVAENPNSSEELTLPPIITGHFIQEFEKTTVTNRHFPYKYEKQTFSQTAEGEFFKNAMALGSTTQNIGKPSIATRLDRKVVPPSREGRISHQIYKNHRYFIDSTGVKPGIRTSEGSKGYPDVDRPQWVKEISETELSIINTQNALTTSIDIDWRSGIEEGDFAIFQGRKWKIFGAEENIAITTGKLKSKSLVISLGYFLEPKVTINRRNQCQGVGS